MSSSAARDKFQHFAQSTMIHSMPNSLEWDKDRYEYICGGGSHAALIELATIATEDGRMFCLS